MVKTNGNKRALISSVFTVVLLSLIISVFLSFSAFANKNDYSKPSSHGVTSIFAASIIELASGAAPSPIEAAYLEKFGDFSIIYDPNVPSSEINLDFSEEEKKLSVIALEYSYTAKNGARFSWIPESVSMGGREFPLIKGEGGYTATIPDTEKEDGAKLTVRYTADITVTKEDINAVINKAYRDGEFWQGELLRLESEYQNAVLEYEKYLAYLDAVAEHERRLAEYEKYLSDKRVYDDAYASYLLYLEELEDYAAAKIKYDEYKAALDKYNEEYAKYLDDLAEAERLAAKMKEYEKYLSDMETVARHLSVIEATKTPVTHLKRTIYSAIMGDTVTSVINNKDAIANELVGASADAVDMAGAATENIRSLLSDYFSISDEAEKYAFYAINYEAIRDNFQNLLRALDKLYQNGKIRGYLAMQEKQEKYIILLSQLYFFVNAVSDTPVSRYDGNSYFDSSYKINTSVDYKTPAQIISDKTYLADLGSAAPLENGYPTAVEKPTIIEPKEPTRPTPVPIPTEPEPVTDPGEPPSAVSDPGKAPDPVLHSGKAPERVSVADEITALVLAYESGALSLRPEVSEDLALSLETSVTKTVFGASVFDVVYYDTDGTRLYATQAELGTFADYVGDLPKKAEDASATYTFDKWVDIRGNAPNLSSVTEHLILYPSFKPNYKSYPISFSVNGTETVEYVTWGELPKYEKTPEKPDSGSVYYEFLGWDKPIAPVSGEESYTALFAERYTVPFSKGSGAALEIGEAEIVADCLAGSDNEIRIDRLLSKAGGKYSLVIKTRRADISVSYAEVMAMRDAGVCYIRPNVTQRGGGGYYYSVELLDGEKNALSHKSKLSVSFPSAISDADNLRLYYVEGDAESFVRYSLSDSKISFTAQTGRQYVANLEYEISRLATGPVSLDMDASAAAPGSLVRLSYGASEGVSVGRAYYIGSSGKKTYIDGGSFIMPAEHISVGVEYSYIEYRISFVSDGKIISTAIYKHGEEIRVPKDPKKSDDGIFSYTFIGWSEEIGAATKDVTYRALFDASRLPKKDSSGLQITEGVLKIIVGAGTAVAMIVLGAVPCGVGFLVLHLIRRKQGGERAK